MVRVLVIDDDQAILNYLKIILLQAEKFELTLLQDSTKAYDLLEKHSHDLLLLDMDMPCVSGIDILRYIKDKNVPIIPIVLTGVEDIDLAIAAMKLDTFDYLLKPIEEEKLLTVLDAASAKVVLNTKQTNASSLILKESLKFASVFDSIITQDMGLIKIFSYIEQFAQTDNSILIWGESGTGKEMIARAIHEISRRKNKRFVAVNSGTFANELFASEFFGHQKGSFSGAFTDKKGFIEEAHEGTLFLDEIGELSLPIQVKLLRVLQEEEFYRLGSTDTVKVDVRIVAATNKNLFEEINNGTFRKDLFFRLNINSIFLPPLRQRKGDIELLANHFLHVFNNKYDKKIASISPIVIKLFQNYSFPGNIRELMNIINSAIIVETSHELRKKALPNYFLEQVQSSESTNSYNTTVLKSLPELEKEHIKQVLQHTQNNRTQAAKILDISRVNLLAKIKKYGLE